MPSAEEGRLLPSVLRSEPALQDTTTTADELVSRVARVTNPAETAIFICAIQDCYRLFPSRDRVMLHRKRDHDTDHDGDIITWNE